ncbi:hypothetical protein Goari_007166 [Gossypium aridum]|uniref:Uncharacterized protein n=1 Tax=Gossypium aridum TaxID=34290 RepID=A0A7J8XQ40_GOSAI|nr:hypothetical protein [Gossypium aridum]
MDLSVLDYFIPSFSMGTLNQTIDVMAYVCIFFISDGNSFPIPYDSVCKLALCPFRRQELRVSGEWREQLDFKADNK